MDKLPDFQTIEDAYQGVADVIKKLPPDSWSNRAKDHLKISQEAAYQGRDRAGIAERSAEPVTVDASVEMISSGPAMTGWLWHPTQGGDPCTD